MVTTKIILQGGGEHARVVLDCLLSMGESVVAIFDPKYRGQLMGVSQLGSYDSSYEPEAKALVAIGDNRLRKQVANLTLHAFARVIHSSVILSKSASIGEGTMILHGSIVQVQTVIGKHVIINTGAQIDHDCIVHDFVHIAPRTVLCGTVEIGEGTLVGAGAVVLPGKKIGKWAVVAAGAVVTKDVADYTTVAGNPAKIISVVARK